MTLPWILFCLPINGIRIMHASPPLLTTLGSGFCGDLHLDCMIHRESLLLGFHIARVVSQWKLHRRVLTPTRTQVSRMTTENSTTELWVTILAMIKLWVTIVGRMELWGLYFRGLFVGDCVVTIYSNLFLSGHYLILWRNCFRRIYLGVFILFNFHVSKTEGSE